jgi:hypothetical protein
MSSLQRRIAVLSKLINELQELSQLRAEVSRLTYTARRQRRTGQRKGSAPAVRLPKREAAVITFSAACHLVTAIEAATEKAVAIPPVNTGVTQ